MSKKTAALSATAVILLVVLLGAIVWFVPIVKVSAITIDGAVRTDTDQAVEVSGIREGDNLIRIDAVHAAEAIADLPWVSSVTVNRTLPSTVTVQITEREASIYVKRDDGEYIIDSSGIPIIIGTPPVGTIEVTGTAENDPNVLPAVIEILTAIENHDAGLKNRIAVINAPNQFDVLLTLDDGREIYWGSAENSHDKAIVMSTVITREGQHWNISAPSLVTVR